VRGTGKIGKRRGQEKGWSAIDHHMQRYRMSQNVFTQHQKPDKEPERFTNRLKAHGEKIEGKEGGEEGREGKITKKKEEKNTRRTEVLVRLCNGLLGCTNLIALIVRPYMREGDNRPERKKGKLMGTLQRNQDRGDPVTGSDGQPTILLAGHRLYSDEQKVSNREMKERDAEKESRAGTGEISFG